jgi:hypothetical protein
MSRGALEGERTLSMMIPALQAVRGASGWDSQSDWTGSGTDQVMMFHAYIDTSGYADDGLTLFPISSLLQDPGRYICSNAAVPIQVLDVITTETLTIGQIEAWLTANTVPGMLGTTHDWSQVMWGQYRTFLGQATFQQNATEYLPASGSLFGSGQPSTADKLHCYRFVFVPGSADGDQIGIPASRFVLNAAIAPEDESSFLMRQKRSYELAT